MYIKDFCSVARCRCFRLTLQRWDGFFENQNVDKQLVKFFESLESTMNKGVFEFEKSEKINFNFNIFLTHFFITH